MSFFELDRKKIFFLTALEKNNKYSITKENNVNANI